MASTSTAATTAGAQSDGLSRDILALAVVVILGTIMTVLDLTIVNVAIPAVGAAFRAPVDTIQWVMTGYMLAFATVIPLTGWAAERFGAKQVWLAALLLFLAGSVLAGAAWSAGSLITFRVIQGLGAGMILPVGQTILAQAAGPQRMGRVMSMIGVPMLLAPVLGPVLGGAVILAAGWRWIFFINLPVGAAALAAAWRLLPDARPRAGQRLDVRGLALLSPGIAVLLYGMSEAGSHGGFASPGSSIPALGGLVLIPLYYQVIRHDSTLQTGLLLAPQGIGAALALSVAGPLTDRIGARVVATAGIVIAVLGTLAYTQVGSRTSYAYLAGALGVIGLGLGATVTPSMAAAFQTLSQAETPRGTSALNAIQRIAGAIGTAAFAILLQHSITAKLPGHAGGVQAISALSRHPGTHTATALAGAFGITFWAAVVLTAAALIPALLLPRPPRAHQAPGSQALKH